MIARLMDFLRSLRRLNDRVRRLAAGLDLVAEQIERASSPATAELDVEQLRAELAGVRELCQCVVKECAGDEAAGNEGGTNGEEETAPAGAG